MSAEHEILDTSAASLDIKRRTGCWAGGDFSGAVKRSWSEHVVQAVSQDSQQHLIASVYIYMCLCANMYGLGRV